MAKTPRNTRHRTSPASEKAPADVPAQPVLQPEALVEAMTTQPPVQAAQTSALEGAGAPGRWLKMETCLSGPAICLSRGEKHAFDDTPGLNDAPSEAQRLINAGFAIDTDPPTDT